ncbi:tripartite motif-containing protein 2-like [Ptychodera flava]|uniref:tripartite motif-containing protein 2-like n=1 Tax=Ptychodera flava TaxID=63121 RepID=UPI00396A5EE5
MDCTGCQGAGQSHHPLVDSNIIMAASKLATSEEILDEIGEDFLTCPVCLEQYKNPKILPCYHTFCQQCLEKLVEKTGSLNCPTCQKSVQLPEDRVSGLDNNFFMNSMLEVLKKRTEESADQSESKCEFCEETEASVFCVDCEQYYCRVCCEKFHKKLKQAAMHEVLTVEKSEKGKRRRASVKLIQNCKIHPKHEINFYCDSCRIPICVECTVIDHRIPDHSHRYLQEVADECNKELSVLVEKLKVKAREVDHSRAEVKDACKKVTEQCLVNKQKVGKQKDALIDKIEKEERKLIEKLDTNCSLQVKGLESDIGNLELKYENLISTCSYTEALMHHGNPAQLVSKSPNVLVKLQELVSTDTKPSLKQEVVEFFPSDDITTDGILGLLRSDVCISQCAVDNKCLLKGGSINAQTTTKDRSGKPVIPRQAVEVTLTKPDGSKTNLDVTDKRDSTHTVAANIDMDGKYQVAMTIGNQEVPGSPFEIPVIKGLVKTLGKLGNNIGEFNTPYSLTINKKGDLVVTDFNNLRIQIIDLDGNWKKTFEFKQFGKAFHPLDIAISADDRYFMTDFHNKQVVVSDEDGKVITTFGQNELKYPRGISISPLDGAVYVSDWDGQGGDKTDKDAHCISKYTQGGQYIKSFGKFGEENGEFKGSWMMVHDKRGLLFVADCDNDRIQVFNADDQFLYKFGIPGKKDGQLFGPSGLCLDSDSFVYVSDCSNRIQKFDSRGRFISRLDRKEDGLNKSTGLVITDSVPRKMIVADKKSHCIKVFEV